MKYLLIKMQDQSIWELPLKFIATEVAYATTGMNSGAEYKEAWDRAYNDVELIRNWVANASWSDISEYTRMIQLPAPPDYDTWFQDALFEVVEMKQDRSIELTMEERIS